MNIQIKKGVIELCAFAILSERDCYGYELAETISNHIEISEGTIYPLLRRLTREGYFTTYLQESSEGPPRKYYKITDRGIEYKKTLLNDWNDLIKGVNELIEECESDE
ncbi:MAG: PadR family transcriptional regulator [Euryarchaeota archaeon]|nr:PadR family transcriptional regulator [Euryarchaeota archaeon]MEA1999284.1 PadR family transcriptional regulator [Euryarchaeota archaeon]